MEVDIVTACGPSGELFIECLIENVCKTAHKIKPRFIIAQHKCDVSWLRNDPRVKCVIDMPDDIPASVHSASFAHGRNLNTCTKKIDTKIAMIIDYDVMFVTAGWDDYVIRSLTNDIGIVGTEYSDAARGCKKYLNYPSIIMCAFRSELLSLHNINFDPKPPPLIIRTNAEATAFCRQVGVEVHRDTGWELGTKLRAAGVKCETLKFTGNVMRENVYLGQEFANDHMIVNHLKSGSMQDKTLIKMWQEFINARAEV